jgi:hypothetical protein
VIRNNAAIGSTSQTVSRAAGAKINETVIRITSMTAKVIACVATAEKVTSCRGKRTLRINDPLSIIERAATCAVIEKNVQNAIPESR